MKWCSSSAIEALLVTHAVREGVVAFDGDGTLWDGDVGDEFFFALMKHGDVRAPATHRLVEEAREHALDTTGTGVELAKRIFAAYQAGQFPERRVCEMIGWLCAGWSRTEVDRFAESTLEANFGERLHPEVIELGLAARKLGLQTVIVSASPLPIVQAAARRVGFDAKVIATTPKYEGDAMVASVEVPIPYDEGKVTGLRALIGDMSIIAAFGDNAFDVPMLQCARVAVAVRPKARLVAREAEVPGLLTVDRTSASALEPRASDA
jgi:phosphatidylglycerophosphatase C